jgi:hypothetical protein
VITPNVKRHDDVASSLQAIRGWRPRLKEAAAAVMVVFTVAGGQTLIAGSSLSTPPGALQSVAQSQDRSPRIEFKYQMSFPSNTNTLPAYTKVAILPVSFLRIAARTNLVVVISRELFGKRPLQTFAVTFETRRGKQGLRGVVDPDGRVGLERQGDMPFPQVREVRADIREVRIVFLSPPPGMGLREFPPRDIRATVQGDAPFGAAAIVSQSPTPRASANRSMPSSLERLAMTFSPWLGTMIVAARLLPGSFGLPVNSEAKCSENCIASRSITSN